LNLIEKNIEKEFHLCDNCGYIKKVTVLSDYPYTLIKIKVIQYVVYYSHTLTLMAQYS